MSAGLGEVIRAGLRSRRSDVSIVAGSLRVTAGDLRAVVAAAESGEHRPVVDRVVDLADIAAAHRRVDGGRKRGSVVVRIAGTASSATRGADAEGSRA